MAEVDLKQLAVHRAKPDAGLKRRRHFVTRYLLPLAIVTGFAALLAWASRDLLRPPRPVQVVPVFVTHSIVRQDGTPLFKAAGWIEPRPTPTRVAALAPGVVDRLLVVEDQAVEAGEPLAELVKEDAQLALQRAGADLKLREAEVEEAKAALSAAETRWKQPVHLQAALAEANATLAEMETMLNNLPFERQRALASLDYAQRDFKGKSAAEGTLSRRVIDKASSELDTAKAMAEELRARQDSLANQRTALTQRRDALQTQVTLLIDETKAREEARARLQAAAARVEQERVAVAEAELRLARMTVRAPIKGRIYRLLADPGARLMEGVGVMGVSDGSTVVTMYRPESLQVRVDVRFEDLPKVQLGQPVTISNPALAQSLPGKVLFISSEADIQKNTLQVKVAIDSPAEVLKPEMLVEVTVLSQLDAEASQTPSEVPRLYLPLSLIHDDEQGKLVWIANQAAGVARKTHVETGDQTLDGLIEITRGLSLTSRAIQEHEGLEDGQRIRVTGEAAARVVSHAASNPADHRSTLRRLPPGETQ